MSVELINDKEIWNKFVDGSQDGSVFHKWDFLKIIEEHTNYRLLSYGIYKGEMLVAIIPLFFRKHLGINEIFSPPPQTGVPDLGMIMSPNYYALKQIKKESYLNKVVDEINLEMMKISPNYISISLPSNFDDIRPFKWNGYNIDQHHSYVIDLKKPLDNIWDDFDTDCRRGIKNANKYNLSLKQTDDVETFYTIMKKRYDEQGLNFPITGPKYLKDILSKFPENIKMYFLYNDDNLINITMNYEYKSRFMFWMGWANLDKDIHSHEYLTWEFIKMAKMNGFTIMGPVGAETKRLCSFQSKYNPHLEINFMVHKKDTLGKLAEWIYLNFIKRKIL